MADTPDHSGFTIDGQPVTMGDRLLWHGGDCPGHVQPWPYPPSDECNGRKIEGNGVYTVSVEEPADG